MQSLVCKSKQIIIAKFSEGEDLILALKQCAVQHNIKAGFFSIIGGLKQISYGLFEGSEYKNIKKSAKHCFELLPTVGNFTLKSGEIIVHAHVIAGDEDEGLAFGGHLMEGSIVYPFAEVHIQELDAVIERTHDAKTNLYPLDL